MWWIPNLNSRIKHIWALHKHLDFGLPSCVTKDMCTIVESLVKIQYKNNALKLFLFGHSFSIFLILWLGGGINLLWWFKFKHVFLYLKIQKQHKKYWIMIVHFMTIYKLYYYNYCMFNFKKKKIIYTCCIKYKERWWPPMHIKIKVSTRWT